MFLDRKAEKGHRPRQGLLNLLFQKLSLTSPSATAAALASPASVPSTTVPRHRKLLDMLKRNPTKAISSAPISVGIPGDPDPFAFTPPTRTPRSQSPLARAPPPSSAVAPMPDLTLPPGATPDPLPFNTAVKRPSHILRLPHDVLVDVATRLDRRALYRLMRTCRALRQAAEVALRPHHAFLGVTVSPPLFPSWFSRADPKIAADDVVRWSKLRRLNRLMDTHVVTFPAAALLLRRLRVDLRTDDRSSGWNLIERFGPQLESLTLHILDELWQTSLEYETDEDGSPVLICHEADPLDNWSLAFFFHPLCLSLPNLTSLTIAATARTFHHFALFAEVVPNVRNLTLSAFGQDELDLDNEPADFPPFPHLPKLERLTVSGDDEPMATLLHSIVASSSHIQYLIIYNSSRTCATRTIPRIANDILDCQSLVGLTIYGAVAGEILCHLPRYDEEQFRDIFPDDDEAERDGRVLSKLEELVVECELNYPLIDLDLVPEAIAIKLPSLRRLTCVDRRPRYVTPLPRTPSGHSIYDDRWAHADPHEFDDDPTLRAVWTHYPQLERVLWTSAYSTDPFNRPCLDAEKGGPRSCVHRPQED